MNPERWKRLKPLFHGALEQPRPARAAWLRGACPDDEQLRHEAEALIDAHETAGDFLETAATLDADSSPDAELLEAVPLDVGQQVGPYVVRGELGRGGMGIVYLAEDVRLGRTVALKALPPGVADDPQRRERLRREARAAAALSHPGIAVVYALEEINGNLLIAAEHIKGRTLRAELSEGPLGPGRALDTAIDIVRALCAAHEARVVHRDLKPENILRTDDGHVKVLDFGIAHVADEALTHLTRTGSVLGTPAYMAPEQIIGTDVDFRADVYAVGVLLVEMATGAHPFASGPRAAGPLPPAMQLVADRCLAKNPRDRYSSTRDLLAALEDVRRTFDGDAGRRTTPVFDTASGPAGRMTPRWWWEFHQGMAALVYWIMVVPMWTARGLIGGLPGRIFFIVALTSVIVSANLRLHLWFTSRFYPGELPWVRTRAARWVTAADWVFTLTLVVGGLLIGERSPLAVLLIAVGVGTALAFLVIEPVTERAAFRESSH